MSNAIITHEPRHRKTAYDKRVGESKKMACGLIATITEYFNRHDITVEMSDGSILYKRTYTAFTKGEINSARTQSPYKTYK